MARSRTHTSRVMGSSGRIHAVMLGVLCVSMLFGSFAPAADASIEALSGPGAAPDASTRSGASPGVPTEPGADTEGLGGLGACASLTESLAAAPDAMVPVQSVPVQSVAQGDVFDHGPPESLLLVSEQPDPIAMALSPLAAQAVASIDFNTHILVGLFIGRWPQGGTRVTIETVAPTADGVCVVAQVDRPDPGVDAAGAGTYPYHVIAAPRAALPPIVGTPWTAVTHDGAHLAEMPTR